MFYNNVNSIKETFQEYGSPVWGLYDGKARRNPPSNVARDPKGRLFYQESEDMDIMDSWSRLENALGRVIYKGGFCTIYVGKGVNTLTIPCYFDHPSQQGGGQAGAGVAGAGGLSGMGYMRELFDEKLNNYELKRTIEDLHAERGPTSFWERVGEKLLENEQLPNLVMGILNGLQRMTANPAQMQAMQARQAAMIRAQQQQQHPEPASDNNDGSVGSTVPSDLLTQQFTEQIRPGFESEEEMARYLSKLAVIFQANPEGMKQVIDQAVQMQQE